MEAGAGIDAIMLAAMASYLDGDLLVSSVTAMGLIAARIAQVTHAPELMVLSTPESGVDVAPMTTLTLGEFWSTNRPAITLSMEDIFDAIFLDRFRIWINPAQIDRAGNVNISAIGPWARPKVALVGARGIPEDTSHLSRVLFYLPQHTPRTLVEQVDFRSGAGYGGERETYLGSAGRPTALVTNLGVFEWDQNGTLSAKSLHPGVIPDQVREATGFELNGLNRAPTTSLPDPGIQQLIDRFDPLGTRHLEFLSGEGADRMRVEIYERERRLFHLVRPRREGGRP
ncbi:MAG: CoA-transferase [Sulfobacillus sp.]